MDIRIGFQNKRIIVKDVVVCKSFFSKLKGLMFGNDKKPLLFVFKKPTKAGIHSFFVKKKFLAVWMLKGKIVDAKVVSPWRVFITPKTEFDSLLEIPFESEKQISDFSSVIRKL